MKVNKHKHGHGVTRLRTMTAPPLGLASGQKQYFFPKQNKIPDQSDPEGSRKVGSEQQEKKKQH